MILLFIAPKKELCKDKEVIITSQQGVVNRQPEDNK